MELAPNLDRLSPLPSIPLDSTNRWHSDPRAIHLGHWLFFDPRLSVTGEVSCATCHDPQLAFTDGKPLAHTLGEGTRKTPTVLNLAYSRWFFWDGRTDSLWAQAMEPFENPIEMGMDRLAIAHIVSQDKSVRKAYEEIFGALPNLEDGSRFPAHGRPIASDQSHPHAQAWEALHASDQFAINRVFSNLGKAIAAYEAQLVRSNAPFDRYVSARRNGDPTGGAQLSQAAQRGLALFLGRGQCTLCHTGPTFSDLEFHNNQVPTRDGGLPQDAGRFDGERRVKASPFNAAGPFSDDPSGPAAARVRQLRIDASHWGEFKTPSLRNLRGRAPYFHAGQMPDLESVLEFYSSLEGSSGQSHHAERILKPLELTQSETRDLIAFLESLEGEPLPAHLLAPPESPRYSGAPPDRGRKGY